MGILVGDMRQYNLADALFPATRQKVLGLIFSQPKRSFLLSEMIKLADAGSGAVQREVERLAASGLVTVTQHGRQKSYQAKFYSPVYNELTTLINKLIGPAEKLRSRLEGEQDVELAILFGSVARRKDTASSGIDVLLVSDTLTLEGVFSMLRPIEQELSRPVNPTLYTAEEFQSRLKNRHPFLTRLLAGEYSILKGKIYGQDAAGESGRDSSTESRVT